MALKKWTAISGISGFYLSESVDDIVRNWWMIYPGLCSQPGSQIRSHESEDEPGVDSGQTAALRRTPSLQSKTRTKRIIFFSAITLLLVVVIAAGGSVLWYYFYGPCGVKKVELALNNLDQLGVEWDDALQVVSSTSRIALSGPLADLQRIRREAEALLLPDCLDTAKGFLINHMDYTIEAFFWFLADEIELQMYPFEKEKEQKRLLERSLWYAQEYVSAVEKVEQCMPFCNKKPKPNEEPVATPTRDLPPTWTPQFSGNQ